MVENQIAANEDRGLEADERAMRLFQSVANSIHPSIKMEIDCPSRHQDCKFPILDLKVWRERKERGVQPQSENRILLEFYSKEVSSAAVINARSALSWSSKRTILTQEVLRILLNCSTELPWQVFVDHVNHMMLHLQYSGYNQRSRTEVIQYALHGYNNILRLDVSGEKPTCRPRSWRQMERAQEKWRKREGWYKKGEYDSVIFVPATPESKLKRWHYKEISKVGLNIKAIEESGITLTRHLQMSNPFEDKKCQRDECPVCRTGGKRVCGASGVTYELICQECRRTYVGETAKSAYSHGTEHLQSKDRDEEQSVMRRHAREKHGGGMPSFVMNAAEVFGDDAMLRQITESLLARNTQLDELINTRNEWNYINIPRATRRKVDIPPGVISYQDVMCRTIWTHPTCDII